MFSSILLPSSSLISSSKHKCHTTLIASVLVFFVVIVIVHCSGQQQQQQQQQPAFLDPTAAHISNKDAQIASVLSSAFGSPNNINNNKINSINNDLFLSEFEIMDMSGHDGRLQNGYCCNGQRPGVGGCKGGNITCLPYWRVCIVEMTPDMTGPVFASRDGDVSVSGGGQVAGSNTSKKPSMLSSFFSKIFSLYGIKSNPDKQASKQLKDILDHMSPSTCRIGFWTSDVIGPETQFPLKMRKPLIWKQTLQSISKSTNKFDRNVMCIVELWSKNPRNDVKNRLIARQVQHFNVFMDSDAQQSEWFYGGKQLPSELSLNSDLSMGQPQIDRRKDKDSKTSTIFGGNSRYRQLTYPPPPKTPSFASWVGPVIPAPSYAYSSLTVKAPLLKHQIPVQNSVFRYKFRWHLKVLNRKFLTSRDGNVNSIDSNSSSVFGYHDEDDDLAAFNLTNEGCPHGYQGADCSVPVCLEGCDQDHGYCEQSNQCLCKFGWTGMHCNYCLTLPGCVHGYCNRPLECRCEDGWTGMFCSIPKCKEGCHSTNGYCQSPGECKCKFGWQGENCTECATLPGCQHGTCNEPLDCLCEPGWQGTFCSTPICSPGCGNGWCKKPNECRCKVGFKGENCTDCVPYPGCDHGFCAEQNTKPWTCECEQGWGGFTCAEQLNWCEQNELKEQTNPCQHGGKCISTESEEGNYRCQCTMGYTGKNCDKLI